LLLECENFRVCESETVECRRLQFNVELEILKVLECACHVALKAESSCA
jgi:hypothetical protein